jgi:uroporphyrinogen-III synthase
MNLEGKRILITRPRLQAGEFAMQLQQLGAVPVFFPVIRISSVEDTSTLDQALRNLDHYQWLVVTSVNGVRAVWKRMSDLHIPALPATLKVAAIGPKTAAALQSAGVQPTFVPDKYVAEAILPGLGELKGQRVLLLRADIARAALRKAIQAAGGAAHEVAVYNTQPVQADETALHALRQGVDCLTFTSSSTVRNFVRIVQQAGFDPAALPGNPLIACIGPITAQTVAQEGLKVDLVAAEYTTEGLIQALLDYQESEP